MVISFDGAFEETRRAIGRRDVANRRGDPSDGPASRLFGDPVNEQAMRPREHLCIAAESSPQGGQRSASHHDCELATGLMARRRTIRRCTAVWVLPLPDPQTYAD